MTYTEYPHLEQGTDEWLKARCGMVTASFIDGLLTTRKLTAIDHECPACAAPASEPCISARSGEPIKSLHPDRAAVARSQSSPTIIEAASNETSRDITVRLAAERITGRIDPVFVTDDMWRGTVEEPLARDKYHHNYAPVRELGFMVRDVGGARVGYPPALPTDEGTRRAETSTQTPDTTGPRLLGARRLVPRPRPHVRVRAGAREPHHHVPRPVAVARRPV